MVLADGQHESRVAAGLRCAPRPRCASGAPLTSILGFQERRCLWQRGGTSPLACLRRSVDMAWYEVVVVVECDEDEVGGITSEVRDYVARRAAAPVAHWFPHEGWRVTAEGQQALEVG